MWKTTWWHLPRILPPRLRARFAARLSNGCGCIGGGRVNRVDSKSDAKGCASPDLWDAERLSKAAYIRRVSASGGHPEWGATSILSWKRRRRDRTRRAGHLSADHLGSHRVGAAPSFSSAPKR